MQIKLQLIVFREFFKLLAEIVLHLQYNAEFPKHNRRKFNFES